VSVSRTSRQPPDGRYLITSTVAKLQCLTQLYKSGPHPSSTGDAGARRRPHPLIGVLRHGSDCDLLGDFDSIIDFDAKMANRTLDLEWQTQST
jgi:hypothetical protein